MPEIDFGDPIQFSPQPQVGARTQNGNAMPQQGGGQQPQLANQPAVGPLPRFGGMSAPQSQPNAQTPQPINQAFGVNAGIQPQVAQPGAFPALSGQEGKSLPMPGEASTRIPKKLLLIIIAVIVLIIVVAIGYFVYSRFGGATATNNASQAVPQINSTTNTTNTTGLGANKDEDNDGLLTFEEEQFGTEVNNPDTDGDGFKDGEEVEKGFNPKGEGKLPTPGRF